MNKALYKLNCVREERRYEGFALSLGTPSLLGRENLLEDISPPVRRTGVNNMEIVRLKEIWKAPRVTGNVSPKHDSPGINLMYPAFSRRACDSLAEFFKPNGELLPLETNIGEYYFYNITTIIDVIDLAKSSCVYSSGDRLRVLDVEHYVFIEAAIEGVDIFRAYDLSINVIVSQLFVDRVLAEKLRGFSFTKNVAAPSRHQMAPHGRHIDLVHFSSR